MWHDSCEVGIVNDYHGIFLFKWKKHDLSYSICCLMWHHSWPNSHIEKLMWKIDFRDVHCVLSKQITGSYAIINFHSETVLFHYSEVFSSTLWIWPVVNIQPFALTWYTLPDPAKPSFYCHGFYWFDVKMINNGKPKFWNNCQSGKQNRFK